MKKYTILALTLILCGVFMLGCGCSNSNTSATSTPTLPSTKETSAPSTGGDTQSDASEGGSQEESTGGMMDTQPSESGAQDDSTGAGQDETGMTADEADHLRTRAPRPIAPLG